VPVRTGRKKAALSELTDPADSANKQALEQKRRCEGFKSFSAVVLCVTCVPTRLQVPDWAPF